MKALGKSGSMSAAWSGVRRDVTEWARENSVADVLLMLAYLPGAQRGQRPQPAHPDTVLSTGAGLYQLLAESGASNARRWVSQPPQTPAVVSVMVADLRQHAEMMLGIAKALESSNAGR